MPYLQPAGRRFDIESAGLALGFGAVLVALIAYNSRFAPEYSSFWERAIVVGFDGAQSYRTVSSWIDVALIPLLFAHLGIRVKRDFLNEGSRREWSMPPRMGGAIGSAMIPAALYAGAVLAALFASTPDLAAGRLEIAMAAMALLVLLNQLGVQRVFPYIATGTIMWLALIGSGIHPVIAGAALALTTPAIREIREDDFFDRHGWAMVAFEQVAGPRVDSWLLRQQDALRQLAKVVLESQAPLTRVESFFQRVSALFVIPVFLLANAGLTVSGARGIDWRVAAGTAIGVLIARAGIALDVAAQRGGGVHSNGERRRIVADGTWLGGVGITMSLFAAKVLFTPDSLESAKLGILVGSLAVLMIAWIQAMESISDPDSFPTVRAPRLSATRFQEEP